MNPGAAWPNKRWPAERFAALAARLHAASGLRSLVLWGPGEADLAAAVVHPAGGAAVVAPPTSVADLVAVVARARVIVSGDTGPLHVAAAVGTPAVGIYGPTDPARNGPWGRSDVTVSRTDRCACHHQRRCRVRAWCLDDIGVAELERAVLARLQVSPERSGP
jgi:ADP-heptose:LPS heptosyltransferase